MFPLSRVSPAEREREEPRHAALVRPVRLAELPLHPALLEKGPDIEIDEDGRRRGGAVPRLDRVEGEQEGATEIEGMTHQAVPLSVAAPIGASR